MHADHTQPPSPRDHRILKIALIAVVMAAIFVADTTTRYEVAVAVFYTVVIFVSARTLRRRGLIALAAACIVMTTTSFALTPHGNLEAGLINMSISIAAIVMISILILKADAARTAAHEAQAHLMRIARAKSLEGLTTSIAHEVNQPLAAIVTSGNACQRWLAQEPPNLDKARQALDRILGDAGRASSIIARVRSLTRGEHPHRSTFDFNEAIVEIIALSQAEMVRTGIHLTTELSPDLPPALAERIQIQQVIGNLLLNAIEALASVPEPTRSMRITSETKEGAIVFSVFDSGTGIPTGVHEHLFEAFWTTKQEGIGIGLSISRAIVESNDGQIWAEPNVGSGAVFRFSVPGTSQEKHL
ncbi:two-component sensor histidine kinase [Xanthomonas cucurbitae]|uniref:histidine kinase n=2 Tax=Xanthomonas cucurbitae TaxID=56453 RepID=A0A2S7DWH0_9XANT|nr:HAMP domain-containing sensor histidine kinase [Xanthomonas cucurbitae]PPU78192.1 two-component sensor histidine kinase [Xanthomonas cucurbitae]WDM78143.1 HAMP domain-containing histidine kinase [Xanthomonas cucurbitae]WDM81823.1 HAMP domain-containing histidine kinase [Xanthomonas cucurbitae]